jgi:hypothetical protein
MTKPSDFKTQKSVFSLAALFIALLFLIAVFPAVADDNDPYRVNSLYLSSESQDDDPGHDESCACPIVCVEAVAGIPATRLFWYYLDRKEAGLHTSFVCLSSRLNRAPPLT